MRKQTITHKTYIHKLYTRAIKIPKCTERSRSVVLSNEWNTQLSLNMGLNAKGLNSRAKFGYGQLFLREQNLSFNDNCIS